ncbi:MAG: type II secretion system secretin GspD [Thiobacillus sp.]|nr:type II secretion system secretin GspD [Thiobacillus sp.]MDP2978437.1 type II secretion system secretin GspD [Thiobacillus sp.]
METNNPKTSRANRVAVPILLATLIAGCAATPKVDQPETASKLAMSSSEASAAGEIKAKADVEERYKLFYGSGVVVKPPEAQPLITDAGGNLTLNFEGADLREVVRTILGDILKENYIVDPRVGGTITLRTAKPIPKSAAMHTLEEVLRMNGAVMIREGDGVFRIVPSAVAGKGNATPQLAETGKPLPGGYSIQIVPLKHIGVADMARILEPLAGEPSSVRIDPLRNLLILSGTQLQLKHMLETVDMFDVDWISGMSVGLFTLQSVDVKTVTGELENLFGDKNLGPLAGAIRVVPIERLNALLVVTPQAKYLEQARTWIERLDRPGAGGGGQRLYVYPVQNGKAENLAGLLNDAFSGKGTQTKAVSSPSLAPGAVPAEVKSVEPSQANGKDVRPAASATSVTAGSGGSVGLPQDVRVIADKDNNALLILASPADYESIESAIRKLDVAVRQVLIEVTIAEITLKDELKYGLEWYFNNGARINGKLDTGLGGIAALVPGFSYSWVSKAADVGAVLNALATDSRLKIISSPHITVADNQKAKIQVGDRVPTISQTQTVASTTTATGIISSIQYTETGVMLSVTPRVNAGGQVTMEINQEVSNATPTTTSGIDSPTIQKRTAESTVTVKSGETIILAGLIKEEKTKATEGLPLLAQIPLIGGLFGTQSWGDNRTELIILITPRVLIDTQDAAAITEEYRSRIKGLERLLKSVALPPKPAVGSTE